MGITWSISGVTERFLYMANLVLENNTLRRGEAAGGTQTYAELGEYLKRCSYDNPQFIGKLWVIKVWENRCGSLDRGACVDGVTVMFETDKAKAATQVIEFKTFLCARPGVRSVHIIELIAVS